MPVGVEREILKRTKEGKKTLRTLSCGHTQVEGRGGEARSATRAFCKLCPQDKTLAQKKKTTFAQAAAKVRAKAEAEKSEPEKVVESLNVTLSALDFPRSQSSGDTGTATASPAATESGSPEFGPPDPQTLAEMTHLRPRDGQTCNYLSETVCLKCGWYKGDMTGLEIRAAFGPDPEQLKLLKSIAASPKLFEDVEVQKKLAGHNLDIGRALAAFDRTPPDDVRLHVVLLKKLAGVG